LLSFFPADATTSASAATETPPAQSVLADSAHPKAGEQRSEAAQSSSRSSSGNGAPSILNAEFVAGMEVVGNRTSKFSVPNSSLIVETATKQEEVARVEQQEEGADHGRHKRRDAMDPVLEME